MGKQLIPVPTRVISRSAIVDGEVMAENGNLVDAWKHLSNFTFTAQKLHRATVHPFAGSASFESPVVAVNHDEVVVVLLPDQTHAAACLDGLGYRKMAMPIVAIGAWFQISGTFRDGNTILASDDKGHEPLLGRDPLSFLVDVTVQSLDPTRPFEQSSPFAILCGAGHDVVTRIG